MDQSIRPNAPSLREAFDVWARIGLMSFGGPAGQIALMHRILVDEKGWIDEKRFLHALNFCMLLPGPEAQQLATYVGWIMHRTIGGLIAGLLFILPGLITILVLSTVYVTAGDYTLVEGIFAGLKPAVVVIVFQALIRISSKSLATWKLWLLAIGSFLAMYVFAVPFPAVIGAAAMIGFLGAKASASAVDLTATDSSFTRSRPLATLATWGAIWTIPTLVLFHWLGGDHVFSQIGFFFSKMAVLTFGGAYAVLAYVSQQAVDIYAWLNAGEMIDGLAMAETTPGPLIMVVQFVGFVAAYRNPGMLDPWFAGLLGSLLTVWVTFVPCFLWIFLGAPHMEKLRGNAKLSGALTAVTAAVVGVIANLAVWFAGAALFAVQNETQVLGSAMLVPELSSIRWSSLAIGIIAAVLAWRAKASIPVLLAVCATLGVLMDVM